MDEQRSTGSLAQAHAEVEVRREREVRERGGVAGLGGAMGREERYEPD